MAYFVVRGKTVTTARGPVTGGVGNDQLTPGCLVRDKTDKALLKAARERLDVLVSKGVLVESDERPVSEVEADAADADAEAEAAADAADAEAEAEAAADAADAEAAKGKGKGKGKGAKGGAKRGD